jgi:diaminopimelate epimerase
MIESDSVHDFFMRYYNADGSEERMCGNGARCSAAFAAAAGVGAVGEGGMRRLRFRTGAGAVEAVVAVPARGRVTVETELMDAADMRRNLSLRVAQTRLNVHFMVVGTRHVLVPVDDARTLKSSDINNLGRRLREHGEFAPQGANVNFVSRDEGGQVHIRTYEKGVENETFACGTGSVAAAVWFAHEGVCESPVSVVQRDGDVLCARFTLTDDGARSVSLSGPADVNFEGTFDFRADK